MPVRPVAAAAPGPDRHAPRAAHAQQGKACADRVSPDSSILLTIGLSTQQTVVLHTWSQPSCQLTVALLGSCHVATRMQLFGSMLWNKLDLDPHAACGRARRLAACTVSIVPIMLIHFLANACTCSELAMHVP